MKPPSPDPTGPYAGSEGVDLHDPGYWDAAQRVVDRLGVGGDLFSAAVRAVRSSPSILRTEDPGRLDAFAVQACSYCVSVSPTLKAHLYLAARERDEAALSAAGTLTTARLLGLFPREELLAVLVTVILTKALKRRCDGEEWGRFFPRLSAHTAVGAEVGGGTIGVGYGTGATLAVLRASGLGALMPVSVKGWRELRRHLERSNAVFAPDREAELFGTTHLHVASVLASRLGFGIDFRQALAMTLIIPDRGRLREAIDELAPDIESKRVSLVCTEAVHLTGTAPEHFVAANNRWLAPALVASLRAGAASSGERTGGVGWLSLGHDEVPPDVRRDLGMPEAAGT